MKTKFKIMSGLIAFIIAFSSSCHTTSILKEDHTYQIYSEKLGVNLNGNEDLNLLQSMTNWKGTPYKYGGNTKKGTDCSGFVSSIYKEVYGKQLQRSSRDMVQDVKFVSKKDLKTGDILFFKIHSRNITHVGIYIADNKFIHAQTKDGVVVTDLNQEYYQKSFYKAGRVKS
jgi:lipoprotein Spr/probable lipoprotein NlpC